MYPYASLATIACVALYNVTVLGVGAARRKHGVSAPATDGPPQRKKKITFAELPLLMSLVVVQDRRKPPRN